MRRMRCGKADFMADMIEKKVKTATPLYAAAGAFLVCALLLPVYRFWGFLVAAAVAAGAYALAFQKWGVRTVLMPAPPVSYATGEAGLDATLAKAGRDLEALEQLNARIPEPELSENIARMERAGRSILSEVGKNPEKAKLIRKFVSYYLPTSIKLLTTYAEISSSGAQGENAASLKQQIRANAATIATAFEAQLDALFAGEELDVSSDITVLDGMARGDGLSGADAVQRSAARNSPSSSGVAAALAADFAAGASPAAPAQAQHEPSQREPLQPELKL